MKHYEVITVSQSTEVANTKGERYYDVDGKICFSCNVYEVIHKYTPVHAGSIDIIKKTLGEESDIEFIKDEPNTFDALIKENYIKCNQRTEISRKFIETIDSPCDYEVQEKYQRIGKSYLNRSFDYDPHDFFN
jgi:activator of HSP90 ATPase